ncbi:MAG: ATP phosphoribosyltransferase regulatory subunit [Alphaproteobacteria bacterium]
MTDFERKALLPAGLRDILPPDAAFEADIVERLVRLFQAYGYDRVRPPLIEFEDSLLSGAGVAVGPQTFRLMDPVSQRMMGVRADITPQIARLARTRLSAAARPLRLSYAGEVLRVRGTQLRPERQVLQVGAELIGSAAPAADAEIIAMAATALDSVGMRGLSVDLTVPRLVPTVLGAHGLDSADATPLRAALDRKDPDGVAAHGGDAANTLVALLRATGQIGPALDALATLDLPPVAAQERDRVAQVAALVGQATPDVMLTLDPVENRGFEYHTGVGFTIFAAGLPGELASGGRYRAHGDDDADADGERATGVTLYVDTILATLTPDANQRRILLPADAVATDARALRAEGWATIAALEPGGDTRDEARRLGCTHILGPDGPEQV